MIFWIGIAIGCDLLFGSIYATVKKTIKKDKEAKSWWYYFWIGTLGFLVNLIANAF
ncbi:hypothetical protein ACFO26_01380 [Lactococcus nasutitermitis]|uniref:Uncharacterized protein n=1 Tax=Lactococcus nasutitermitis TaxID=1652957 RepID=A0ABV9JDK9_9LACT|nr:hypothetical protein [Lactococcus nasutitermitis]